MENPVQKRAFPFWILALVCKQVDKSLILETRWFSQSTWFETKPFASVPLTLPAFSRNFVFFRKMTKLCRKRAGQALGDVYASRIPKLWIRDCSCKKRKSVSTTRCVLPWSLAMEHFHDDPSGYSERWEFWLEKIAGLDSLYLNASLSKNRFKNHGFYHRQFLFSRARFIKIHGIQYFGFRKHFVAHSILRPAYVKLHEILELLCRGKFSPKPCHLEDTAPSKSNVSRIIGPTKSYQICNPESRVLDASAWPNRFFE